MKLGKTDFLVLLVVLIWGSVFAVIKYSLQEIAPLAFATARFIGAVPPLFLALLLIERKLTIRREEWIPMALVGITGIGIYQPLFTVGLAHTTASNSSLIIATSPILTAIFAAAWGHERVSWRQVVGIILSFAGVAIIIRASGNNLSLNWDSLQGDILTVGAAIFNSLSVVLAKKPLERSSALRLMAFSALIGVLVMLPLGWRELQTQNWSTLSSASWLGLLYAIVFSSVIAYVLWYKGIADLGATRTMLYNYLVPVVAVTVAVLTLGETFTLGHALGALIIFTGIALARLGGSNASQG